MKADNIKIIGITGGIGSGKSIFAETIREQGFTVIDTDSIAKDLMNNDEIVRKKLIEAIGKETYDPENGLNKEFLAKKVFNGDDDSKENLQKLNSIVHPAVIDQKIKIIEELAEKGEEIIFIESALIFEAGLQDGYDYVINISADKEIRKKRLQANRKMTDKQIEQRMNEQLSDEEKIRLADFNIKNNGEIEELKKSADFILSLIDSLPQKDQDQLST
jgi:dephospho-CoA kinase